MVRLIKRDRGNYTNVSNILLRDSQLSWKARGIFCYLWSQANEWQFYVAEIATHATDGVKALRSGLDELEAQGYLKRVNKHSKTGSFDGMDWILDDKGSLKKIQEDSDVNRRDHFGDDAQMAQNQPKKCQNTSDAKGVQPVKGRTQNGTLRNNNNKNYQNKEVTKKRNISNVPEQGSETTHTIPYKKIIDYLNQKTGKHYKPSSKANQRLIKARWGEGYRLNDFKKVIDNKSFSWQGTKMATYLRPETLFNATKFESYLNENAIGSREPTTGGYEELMSSPNIEDIPDDDLPF